jgi:hypothetical protein
MAKKTGVTVKEFDYGMSNAFTGAEGWAEGQEPIYLKGLLDTGAEFIIVLDKAGGCLMCCTEEEINDEGGYQLSFQLPTKEAAYAFAYGMQHQLKGMRITLPMLLAFGFQEQE